MGFVCESGEVARNNRNFADKIISSLSGGFSYEPSPEAISKLHNHKVSGVLTLENVIEKILQMDIKDEKDVERRTIPSPTQSQRTKSGK